jgi:hypothetical protein
MYYVFEKEGTRIIKDKTVFEKSGYFGKIVFKGGFEDCLKFLQ